MACTNVIATEKVSMTFFARERHRSHFCCLTYPVCESDSMQVCLREEQVSYFLFSDGFTVVIRRKVKTQ